MFFDQLAVRRFLEKRTGEFARCVVDVDASRRAERGAEMLQDMLDAVSAYPFEKVSSLGDPALRGAGLMDPDLRIDLGVTPVKNDLLRIEATVVDSATSEQLGRFVTYRSRG